MLAACSGDEEAVADPTPASSPSEFADSGSENASIDDVESSENDGESSGAIDEGPTVTASEPVVRVPDNEGAIDGSNWLAHGLMEAESVELVWSPVDGAKTYRLYRVPTLDADYDAITAGDVSGLDEVFEGDEYGYIDTDVPSNVFLTYVVVAELDNGSTEPRWTEALTIDDVTPPTPVTGLTASVTDDGVLLEWQPSTDDVEFASYSVHLLTNEGTAKYLGGGADEGQTSFLDTDPLDGENRYVVTAVDFHDNQSEPAEITVTS